jgi:phosphoribosylformylglycinamidine cyclo-ligase
VRLRPDVSFVLDRWPAVSGLFRWLQGLGSLSDSEMFQTFNMGVGFALVVRPERAPAIARALARAGARDAVPVGHVERGSGVTLPELGLRYDGYS